MTSRVGLIPIPFTGGYYNTRSKPLSSQRLINWYVNVLDSVGLNPESLYHTPGLREVIASVGGINRGAWVMEGVPYFVNGDTLFSVIRSVDSYGNASYSASAPLGVVEGTGDVIMDSVKDELCIVVPGQYAYIYTVVNALDPITDPDFDGPVDDVVAIGSVFVFIKTGTNKVFHSQLNNGHDYNALDFYLVNQMDVCVGLIAYRNILYVMGPTNIVPFGNVGGAQFLFAPQPNSVIPTGLRTKYGKTPFKDSFVWLGNGLNEGISLWMYSGGAPQKISTEPIDYLIQNISDEEVEQAKILRHSQNGANFVVFSIGDFCFVYDLAASLRKGVPIWHERRSQVTIDGEPVDSPWRVKSIIQAYNRVFVGDSADGRIGEIADDLGTEYGNHMLCVLVPPPQSNAGIKTKVKGIEVYTDVGVAPDDVMNLSWSDDGGFTWSNKIECSLGKIGEYGRRVTWTRLGAFSLARQIKIEYSGVYPRGINGIYGNAN